MQASISDDSTLLARWALEHSEQAFAELVRQYERLVLAAALRRTGDAELARDVAQQVFATLAAKARLLIGRRNIAGWLYQAASYIAARTVQAERRRQARQQCLSEPAAHTAPDAHWPLLEEALGAIGAADRESLVLHYFQDLAYPQIAAALGIREAAARKRVSRALRNLEIQIRRRGIRGSAAALLVGAAAQQCAMTAEAGFASAAMAASATVSTPILTLTTFMSHASLKVACASAIALTPLFFQWHANAGLRAEISTLRRAQPQRAVATDAVSARQRESTLATELAATRAARIATEKRFADLSALKDKFDQEVVISLGTIESMARKLARVLSTMHQLENNQVPPGSEAFKQREIQTREVAQAIPEMMNIVREIPRLERDPDKAAHFYATMAGETIGLDQSAQAIVAADIATWLRQLQQDGLALIQRPRGTAKEWDLRRNEATRKLVTQLKPKLPPAAPGRPGIDDIFQLQPGGDDGLYEFLTTEGQP
jgi:RNA polymerase sigma factor (sigma-70 family)